MQKIILALAICLVHGFIRAQENTTVRQLGVNTFGTQVIGVNNYAPAGSPGNNLWIGNGGQLSTWASGDQGSYNVSLGSNSLVNNTSGNNNLGLGSLTLEKNTIGESNAGIGIGALNQNISGSNNLALGFVSLYFNTAGSFNTAIGRGSLVFNTIGNFNTGIGYNSLYSTTGSFNIGLGPQAMYVNTGGSYNIAIGTNALYGNTTGNGNIALGNDAGYRIGSGSNNQTAFNSIFIGADTRANTSGSGNEIVIGYQSIGNGSNTTTIGNSSTQHTVFQYGKTLVGYSAAQDRGNYALQVNGQIYATNSTIATSDARLKERVEPLWSGLKEVMALRPCTFSFKQGSGQNLATGRQVGFIAQEVASVVEDEAWAQSVVQEAGGNLGIAETKLLPLLVKAMQEQQAQIESLNARLLLLQSQINKREEKAERTKYSAKKVVLRK